MTNIKRVSELVVGDIVVFPGEKRVMTISKTKKLKDWGYMIYCVGVEIATRYQDDTEVIYLGRDKKEETMKEEKRVEVGISAIYPYFDLLAIKEVSLQNVINLPVYVKEQLKDIHKLFEDVLDLTLAEVKALYFERKGSMPVENQTKKVKELCIGDKIALVEKIWVITQLRECSNSHIEIRCQDNVMVTYEKDKVVKVVLS